ncbi:MAG: 2-oxoacid:ferredoxin oxidoreductase subunit beta [Planctomycetaceae bacterium]|nr:2-oxoacid:ferredoxin oxidoreductase subunit beta [Planctomycetota bacterium]NUN51861.1 2-oxoacid:ferredoxin oxidoreductase subunit beta [Planctomycetaceae bacterium]
MTAKVNRIGLPQDAYKGGKSTLCPGCGHDAVTASLIRVLFESGVEPWRLAKMSGIGCSSKTPGYFSSGSWAFNACHGRMPPVATGAVVANRTLLPLGVSGDGDTASIGLGHFVHALRRNVPLCYVVENNGVYGLTKGQFSATADRGAKLRGGEENTFEPVDVCTLALELGCGFVARSFAADKRQLETLLKAALSFPGTSVLDVVSPCVTFNDHEGSTRSYAWGREREHPVVEVGFVPHWEAPEVEIPAGEVREVPLPDGSLVRIRKVEEGFDTADAAGAWRRLREARARGEFLTGLFHLATGRPTFVEGLDLVEEPLALLPEGRLRPPRSALEDALDGLTP